MNFFVNEDQIKDNLIKINGSDYNHIKNVLRKNVDEEIDVICNSIKYHSKIVDFVDDYVICEILDTTYGSGSDIKLTIFQGLAKADKIEYIIQKATELGVYEVVPTAMKRSIVKLDEKDRRKKLERWQKIAEGASKQSRRFDILRVEKIVNFNDMIIQLSDFDLVIVAYENEKELKLKDVLRNLDVDTKNIAVVIGPEGGIDDSEIGELEKVGSKIVTLGDRILRTETAPVAIAAMIMYELDY